MRSADSWLDEYGQSHQNPTNKMIHWICVPLIVWTVTALIWAIPSPVEWLNWAVLMAVLAMIWYIALSPRLAIGIGLFLALCLAINAWVESTFAAPLWLIAVVVFVAAWIGRPVHRPQHRGQETQLLQGSAVSARRPGLVDGVYLPQGRLELLSG